MVVENHPNLIFVLYYPLIFTTIMNSYNLILHPFLIEFFSWVHCNLTVKSIKYIKKGFMELYLVLSDSLSSLQKLKSSRLLDPDNHFNCFIRVWITSLQGFGKSVTLIWISGHTNFSGNKIAESRPKHGAWNPIITLTNFIPLRNISFDYVIDRTGKIS